MQPLERFQRLVAFDSTSSRSILPIAGWIADSLSTHARVELLESGPEKVNLVATVGPQRDDGAGLILSGHMDCVPAVESGWESEPFQLTDRGDRWVGRGASDMKGFLALAIDAMLRTDPSRLTAPLMLLFTHDEEVGTLGARAFLDQWSPERPLPRSCVIGEPTSNRVVRLHKGHLKLRLSIHGVSAHSGYPHLGVNAIERAALAIAALAALRETMQGERVEHHQFFDSVPFVPLNVGTIHGGAAVNVVPDRCIVDLGLRPIPGVDVTQLQERVRAAVAAVLPESDSFRLEMLSDSPALLLNEEALIHRQLSELLGQRNSESVSFATDGGWFQKLGLECVLFGPGSIEVAHRPNEFMPKGEFAAATPILDQLIDRFCVATS